MLNCLYGTYRHPSSGTDPGEPGGLRQGHAGGLDGIEDCRPSFNRRGATARLDFPGFRADTDEPESMDPRGQCRRIESPEEQTDPGTPVPADTTDGPGGGTAFRAIPSRFWPEPVALGWTDSGRALKAPFWRENESAASPGLDAPTGLSAKKSQLCLSSSPGGRRAAISPGFKKNFKIWGLEKRWSFRMRRDSPSIRDWDGAGPREDILFAFPRPANINNGLISRVGWLLSWGATGSSVRNEETGQAS
jgi:hypothetical protein